MKKRLFGSLLAVGFLLIGSAAPASADKTSENPTPPDWVKDMEEFPVEVGAAPTSLTERDEDNLATFKAEFPWKEAFGSFGCDASQIDHSREGTSMKLSCDDSPLGPEEVSQVSPTVIDASLGDEGAISVLSDGRF